ncbi:Leucine-rich repeat-containing protein 72 [Durusdinium trenchii]|uniref:Leucine-rich repeat-containing protein 72 n=1 Tax=Durusdinium trenchii TaxID=1381693 RepID=A0ABP0SBJ0_9DINO
MAGAGRAGGGRVVSKPMAELAVKNAKYVKNCTELYMANKSIEELQGFARFVNLEVLWLNNNELRRISHLDSNFRIKSLYAHNNKLTTVAGSISKFKFIETLHLFNNKISNLEKCLAVLSRLNHLRTLDLFNNPVAQEENYRLRVICAMPDSLEVLDRHKVTPEERILARKLFGRKGGQGTGQVTVPENLVVQRPASELVGCLSGCTELLLNEVHDILERREQEAADKAQKGTLQVPEVDETAPLQRGLPRPTFWASSGSSGLYGASEVLSTWEQYAVSKLFEKELGDADLIGFNEMTRLVDQVQDELARKLAEPARSAWERMCAAYPDEVEIQDPDNGDNDPPRQGNLSEDDEEHNGSNAAHQAALPRAVVERALVAAQWTRWDSESNERLSSEAFRLAQRTLLRANSSHAKAVPGEGEHSNNDQEDVKDRGQLNNEAMSLACKATRFSAVQRVSSERALPTEAASASQNQRPGTAGSEEPDPPESDSRFDYFEMFSYAKASPASRREPASPRASELASGSSGLSKLGLTPSALRQLEHKRQRQQASASTLRDGAIIPVLHPASPAPSAATRASADQEPKAIKAIVAGVSPLQIASPRALGPADPRQTDQHTGGNAKAVRPRGTRSSGLLGFCVARGSEILGDDLAAGDNKDKARKMMESLMWWAGLLWLVSVLSYILPQMYLKMFGVQNLKEKYNAKWALVTGESTWREQRDREVDRRKACWTRHQRGRGCVSWYVVASAENPLNCPLTALAWSRSDKLLDTSVEEYKKAFPGVEFRKVPVNLATGDFMPKLVEATKDVQVSIVVNNAGYIKTGFLSDVPIEALMANHNCNSTSAMMITHHFVKEMQAKKLKGCVTFTSSPAGFMPCPFSVIYGATKAYLTTFAQSLAPEIRGDGIDVCVVHPSPVASNFYEGTHKIGALLFFKSTATGPDAIANILLASVGRQVTVDQGYYPMCVKVLLKIVDVNLMADMIASTASFLPDYKQMKQKAQ